MTDLRNLMLTPDLKTPKFFGRRKGRTIRKAKSFLLENFLKTIQITDQTVFDKKTLFSRPFEKFYLEIGFGDGAHLAGISQKFQDIGFVGVEVFQNGIAHLLTLLTGVKNAEETKENIALLPDRTDNVRVYDDDARLLFARIPDSFFDKIYLLFPDPWPKKRHIERRFINKDNLKELNRILKTGGILQIATDHSIYKRHVLRKMHEDPHFKWTAKCSDDWRYPPKDWVETKYQKKALKEGRRPVFFEYQKV